MKDSEFSRVRLPQTMGANFDPGSGLYSEKMCSELLVLHEEMIRQLQQEGQRKTGSPGGFIAGMIMQHEDAAAVLRTRLGMGGDGGVGEFIR